MTAPDQAPRHTLSFSRIASREECGRLARLARDIWIQHYVGIVGIEQVEYMLERFQSKRAIAEQIEQGFEYYLALEGDEPAGYLGLVPGPEGEGLMISKIYVRSDRRGSGFGCAALELAEQRARHLGHTFLWLTVNKHNHDTIAWYCNRGFVNHGPVVADIGNGFVMDDYKMIKPLP